MSISSITDLHPNKWKTFQPIWDAVKDDPPNSVLDIGCGYAVYDALLFHHGVQEFHLIDGDGEHGVPHQKFADQPTRPWGNVFMGQDYMRVNSPGAVVHVYPITSSEAVRDMNEKFHVPVDLVMSIKSWCHHYSANTYAKMARRCLKEGGRLIVDQRIGHDTDSVLIEAGFSLVTELKDKSNKCRRKMWKAV